MAEWQRTLRVLWLVQFLTTLAMNLGLTFVPFFLAEDPVLRVEDESARMVYTGLILAGPFFTTIIFTPFWGWVGDRTGPKQQVVRSAIGLGVTQMLMAVAQSPDQMVAIRMLQGMISGGMTANLTLVSAIAPKDKQGWAISVLQSAMPVGQIFGPIFGGILATSLGFRSTYALISVIILLTGIVAWRLLRYDGFVPTASPNPFIGLYRSAVTVVVRPLLRQAFVVLIAAQFAFTVAQGVFAIYAGKLIDTWAADQGVVQSWWNTGVGFTAIAMTITGLASVFSSMGWGRFHDRSVPFLTPIGTALLAGSMLLLTAWPIWWIVLIARVGVGIGVGATSTLQFALISSRIDTNERGQMLGLATSMMHIGNLTGFVLGGVLASWWSEAGNFLLSASVYLVVSLAAFRLEWQLRSSRSPSELLTAPSPQCSVTAKN